MPNDRIYDKLQAFGLGLHKDFTTNGQRRPTAPDADENRPSRTMEEMAHEAAWLRQQFSEN